MVRAIGTGSRFVLLETGSGINPAVADGQELRCFRSETGVSSETAVVRVSRERKPPFIVADVLSGQPQAGDEVYVPARNALSAAAPAPPAPALFSPAPPAANPNDAPAFR